ncbi:MAG TPA: hypothetical protein VGQ13_01625 [Nitrososphaera sp.]|jgi:hypothetical protein|nr:hypothetical protein [Nitrososphaera sp.]
MSDERRNNIFEVLDELIFHLNTTKSMFTFLIISSFILAPLAIIVAAVFAFNPRFLPFIIDRVPGVATIIIAFIVIVVILASVWLAIGMKERAFFSAWNSRFSRFVSLKERIDRELEKGESSEEKGPAS